MTKTNSILVGILAATDAVFRPQRKADWQQPAPTNLYEARQRFAATGVPWKVGGDGGARLAGERALVRLQEVGLLVLYGKGKRSGVRLSEPAEAGLRSLCGLPSVVDAHAALCEVIRLAATADGIVLTPEIRLAKLDNWGPDCETALWKISLRLLPAMVRGWVESRSDIHGRACYIVTDAGREVAKQPAPTLPVNLPEWSEPAGRFYHDQTIAARQQLRTATPSSPSETGAIPLSASLDLRRPRRRKEKDV